MKNLKFLVLLCWAVFFFAGCNKDSAKPECYEAMVLETVCNPDYYAIQILNADIGIDNWRGSTKTYDNVITIHHSLLPEEYLKTAQKFYFSNPIIENITDDVLCMQIYAGSTEKIIKSFNFSLNKCNETK